MIRSPPFPTPKSENLLKRWKINHPFIPVICPPLTTTLTFPNTTIYIHHHHHHPHHTWQTPPAQTKSWPINMFHFGSYDSVSSSFEYLPPSKPSLNTSNSTSPTPSTSSTKSDHKIKEQRQKWRNRAVRDEHTKNLEQKVDELQQQLNKEKEKQKEKQTVQITGMLSTIRDGEADIAWWSNQGEETRPRKTPMPKGM